MSFVTAVQNASAISARNKIDRLLFSLPEEEAEALVQLLHNSNLSLEKVSQIIREEAQEGVLEPDYFDVSPSAVKRWRTANPTAVNGL